MRLKAWCAIAIIAWVGCGGESTGPDREPDPQPTVTNFSFLIGFWDVVSRYDDGDGFVTSTARAKVSSDLGGRALKEQWVGVRGADAAEMISLVIRGETSGTWILARGDGQAGTFDILQGRFLDDAIELVTRTGSRPDGGLVRESYGPITEDGFSWRAERSDDDGATWVEYWTMEYTPSTDTSPLEPPTTAAGCAGPEHREFDFWEGDWVVGSSSSNDLRSHLGGCVLEENWESPSETGTSYNMYDERSGLWHQVWTDTNGLSLVTHGGLDGDQMVLLGELGSTLQRITWIPLTGGDVRQRGEGSTDGGSTWAVSYDLVYTLR